MFLYDCYHVSGDLTLPSGAPKDPKDVRPVVICGFGEIGQTVANMLESPFAISLERGRVPYVAFDMAPQKLDAARAAGFNVLYGDGSRPQVRSGLQQCIIKSSRPNHNIIVGSFIHQAISANTGWTVLKF